MHTSTGGPGVGKHGCHTLHLPGDAGVCTVCSPQPLTRPCSSQLPFLLGMETVAALLDLKSVSRPLSIWFVELLHCLFFGLKLWLVLFSGDLLLGNL